MPGLEISERAIGHVTVLKLKGRLVLDEGDVILRQRIDALIRDGRFDVVLNLHDVTYLDSSGIGCLVAKYLSLQRRGGDLKLVCPSDRCRRVLDITGLFSVFKPFESEEAAVRSLTVGHEVVA